MGDKVASDSISIKPAGENRNRMQELNEASNNMHVVLQLASETCSELGKAPFSDTDKVNLMSSQLQKVLRQVRERVVSNLDILRDTTMEPLPHQSGSVALSSTKEFVKDIALNLTALT